MTDTTSPMDLSGQMVLGRYRLLRLLGAGGMGKAYLAQQNDTGLRTVVKIMHEKFMQQQRFREQFGREMTFLQQFEHPHVVHVLENGLDPRVGPCIVMEY